MWRARELVEIADRHEVGRRVTLIGLSVALAEETGPDEGETALHDHADTDVFQKKGHTAGVRPKSRCARAARMLKLPMRITGTSS